ncbi:MAG: D-aminoacyl-tRNA deacylase [Halobacteriales archaeon]
MIGIVVSRADSASEHVGEHLLSLLEWDEREDDGRPEAAGGGTVYRSGPFELRTFEELHLHLDGVAEAFGDPDLVAFASRHSGETGPLLTAHFPGNFGPAEYGGEDHAVSQGAPAALDRVAEAFDDYAPPEYAVAIECTHHGPTDVGAPTLFVELGSDDKQWADPDGAEAVARAILALDGVAVGSGRTVVGFGGGHYVPRFDRIRRETDWQVGHVGADWALSEVRDFEKHRDLLRAAFERSGGAHAVLDGDLPDLAAVLADMDYRVVSETWVRETDGVPLDLVGDVEDTIGTVDDGLRFGDAVDVAPPDVTTVDLPDDLLAAALAADGDRTREAVAGALVAYDTEEGGTRPQGRAVVRSPADVTVLVDRLASVLATDYETVEVREDAVVATESAFDPDRAREYGVEPGPAFGRLAEGETVEVDGELVRPADVTAERTVRFEL